MLKISFADGDLGKRLGHPQFTIDELARWIVANGRRLHGYAVFHGDQWESNLMTDHGDALPVSAWPKLELAIATREIENTIAAGYVVDEANECPHGVYRGGSPCPICDPDAWTTMATNKVGLDQ